ncbi:MAG: sodium:solute symporter family protein [Planctomycetes bacterium]|nr:sodium:solute symporter family protein [Planctomycetota bacterium]
MHGLCAADIAVIALYLVGITVIGVRAGRGLKLSADFFMPRRFGKLFMVMFSFGSGTHSDQAVGVASKIYTSGLSGIWYQWLWLPVTPFYWLIAPVMRRARAVTTADFFQARYDLSVAMLYAVVGMLNLSINIGMMLLSSGEVISAATRDVMSADLAIALMTVIFVVYGVAGGLSAAIVTDFVQGVLTIVFSFLLLPFILHAVGGMTGIRAAIDDPAKLSVIAPEEIGWFYITVIALNALLGVVTQPHALGNCAAGRTEMDGRVGFMFGNIVKRICTIPWALIGLAAIVYFAQTGRTVEPDKVFGTVAGDFLPRVLPGLLGVFIAALLASVMSSCDAFMISSSALFTENFYRPLAPARSERHYINVGRVASVGVVAAGVAFAYWLPGIVAGLEIFWKISAMMAIPFWLGLFWRRTTVAGAWAATLVSFAVWFGTSRIVIGAAVLWDFDARIGPYLPDFMLWQDRLYLPWQMVLYLAAGLGAGIVVSLLTRPAPAEKLDHFYALLRTPVTPGEQVAVPCTLPPEAVVPPRRNLLPGTTLEIPIPSATGLLGFGFGWICVGLFMWVIYWIAGA